MAGKVGEGVMKAVNAVTRGIVILLYQPTGCTARLMSEQSEQEFRASIEFVALGKTYRYETRWATLP